MIVNINKTRDYAVITKSHLLDTRLSLASKGLYSLMYSLSRDNFTTDELVCMTSDGVETVKSALKELTDLGYLSKE